MSEIRVDGARETLGRNDISPLGTLKNIFKCGAHGNDAVYDGLNAEKLIGAVGMKYDMPVCNRLLGDAAVSSYIRRENAHSVIFDFGDYPKLYLDGNERADCAGVLGRAYDIYLYMLGSAGEFGADGSHVINLKSEHIGTHFDVNLLIGNRIGYPDPLLTTPKGALDSLGRGSFRAGEDRQVTATSYSLHPEMNGDPCNRQFYIYENGKQIFYSADVNTNVKSAVCTHYDNRTVIEYETECGLKIIRKLFILPQYDGMPDAVEVQTVEISDLNGEIRKLNLVFTGMFGLCTPESMMNDVIYAGVTWESGVLYKDSVPVGLAPKPYPDYLKKSRRFCFIVSDGEYMDSYTANYEDFIGNGNLLFPQNGAFLQCREQTKFVPFFALGKSVTVYGKKACITDELTGIVCCDGLSVSAGDEKFARETEKLIERFSSHENTENALCDVISFMKRFSGFLKLESGERALDGYVNNDLPFQVYYQSYVSRSFAWTQKAFRQTGFREIQDMYASLYYIVGMGEYGLARSMLTVWAENVYEMGYANHNFYKTGKEPGVCSDDGLWLVNAVYRYVSLTGDREFLDKTVKICGGGERALIETLNAVVTYSGSISVGSHGLPLLDRADWNDCLKLDNNWLDGPEKEKLYKAQLERGGVYGDKLENDLSESVMNAFLLKIAYDNLAYLMAGERAEEMKKRSARLSDYLRVNCFVNDFYVRAFVGGNREYKYLGSGGDMLSADGNIDGTYFLNSFSWSVISGVADGEQIRSMVGVIKKYLMTDYGFRLCTPCALGKLASGTSASVYFPGDRENGGVFKHAEMMAAYAMISASRTVNDEALSEELLALASFALDTVLPYKTLDNPFLIKGNPRFCTQYTNSVTGESIGPMLSGTASWLSLTVFNILGIDISDGYVSFSPVLLPGRKRLDYTLRFESGDVSVSVRKAESSEKKSVCPVRIRVPSGGMTENVGISL